MEFPQHYVNKCGSTSILYRNSRSGHLGDDCYRLIKSSPEHCDLFFASPDGEKIPALLTPFLLNSEYFSLRVSRPWKTTADTDNRGLIIRLGDRFDTKTLETLVRYSCLKRLDSVHENLSVQDVLMLYEAIDYLLFKESMKEYVGEIVVWKIRSMDDLKSVLTHDYINSWHKLLNILAREIQTRLVLLWPANQELNFFEEICATEHLLFLLANAYKSPHDCVGIEPETLVDSVKKWRDIHLPAKEVSCTGDLLSAAFQDVLRRTRSNVTSTPRGDQAELIGPAQELFMCSTYTPNDRNDVLGDKGSELLLGATRSNEHFSFHLPTVFDFKKRALPEGGMCCAFIKDGRTYVLACGGVDSRRAEPLRTTFVYSPEQGIWRVVGALPHGVSSGALIAMGTNIYLLGGIVFDHTTKADRRILKFDTQTEEWTVTRFKLPLPTCYHAVASCLETNSVYVSGGQNEPTDMLSTAVFRLSLNTGVVHSLPSLVTPRVRHRLLLLDGCLYELGGYASPVYFPNQEMAPPYKKIRCLPLDNPADVPFGWELFRFGFSSKVPPTMVSGVLNACAFPRAPGKHERLGIFWLGSGHRCFKTEVYYTQVTIIEHRWRMTGFNKFRLKTKGKNIAFPVMLPLQFDENVTCSSKEAVVKQMPLFSRTELAITQQQHDPMCNAHNYDLMYSDVSSDELVLASSSSSEDED